MAFSGNQKTKLGNSATTRAKQTFSAKSAETITGIGVAIRRPPMHKTLKRMMK